MRKLSFETPDIMDILNHQVIHMDQAVTYCPEYLVTGKMRNYLLSLKIMNFVLCMPLWGNRPTLI